MDGDDSMTPAMGDDLPAMPIGAGAKDRIGSLDLVRGLAVMGILVANIIAFGQPMAAYLYPAAFAVPHSAAEDWMWVAQLVLIDGKMRGLFSLLFGASAMLVIERATANGRSAAFTHYSRMAWLFVFGMAHYWFLWWGDILAMYAMSGLFLFLWRKSSAKVLRNWALGLLIVWSLFGAVQMVGMATALSHPEAIPAGQQEQFAQTIEFMSRFMGIDTSGIPAEIARMKGDYAGIVEHRFVEQRWKMLGFGVQGLPTSVGIMLLGAWLFRSGFLTGAWDRRRYVKVAAWCLSLGFLASGLVGTYMIREGFTLSSLLLGFAINGPFQILAAIGWAALIIALAKPAMEGAVATRLAAAGRMAFTNYLSTSILMGLVFYGYGLNQYAQWDRFAVNLFAVAMWAGMLLWSKPWLERFHYGPFEWLWRSLARFKPQPMLRRDPAPATLAA